MVFVFEDILAFKKRLVGNYPFCFLTYFRQHTMVFSSKDKNIIKSNYEEKGCTVYGIFKKHKSKEEVYEEISFEEIYGRWVDENKNWFWLMDYLNNQ